MIDKNMAFSLAPPEGVLHCGKGDIARICGESLGRCLKRPSGTSRFNSSDLERAAAFIIGWHIGEFATIAVNPSYNQVAEMNMEEICAYLDVVWRKSGQREMEWEAWRMLRPFFRMAWQDGKSFLSQVLDRKECGAEEDLLALSVYAHGKTARLLLVPNPEHIRRFGTTSLWDEIFPHTSFGRLFRRIPNRPHPLERVERMIACGDVILLTGENRAGDDACVAEIEKFGKNLKISPEDRQKIGIHSMNALCAMRDFLRERKDV